MNYALKPSELACLLPNAFRSGLKTLIVGYPGVGKTEIVRQAAIAAEMGFWISHPAISDPTDYKGMPVSFKQGKDQLAEFLPFGDLRKLIEATKPTVAFLDDIGQATFGVQAALMQLIQERRVNGHRISDHVTFCGATNNPSMKAGVVGMIEPLKSRWDSIVNLRVDNEQWIDHAMEEGMVPELIAFHRAFPTKLHPLTLGDPEEQKRYQLSSKELTNMPCPRTVASVGKWLKAGVDSFAVIAGAAGEGYATEFLAYLNLYQSCPDPKVIIRDPKAAPVPDNPSAVYAITTALACHADSQSADAIIEYGTRLPKSHEVRMHQLCIKRYSDFWGSAKGTKWCLENSSLLTA